MDDNLAHIVHHQHRLEGELTDLERELEKMDVVAKQLVSHSTSLWLADGEKPPQSSTA